MDTFFHWVDKWTRIVEKVPTWLILTLLIMTWANIIYCVWKAHKASQRQKKGNDE
jgi:hypothetical protein